MADPKQMGSKARNIVREAADLCGDNVTEDLIIAAEIQAGHLTEAVAHLMHNADTDLRVHDALVYLAADCQQDADNKIIDAKLREKGRK